MKLERKILMKIGNADPVPIVVRVGMPYRSDDGFWQCPVSVPWFTGDETMLMPGVDQIHAMEVAIKLVDRALRDTKQRKFFFEDGTPYYTPNLFERLVQRVSPHWLRLHWKLKYGRLERKVRKTTAE